MNSKNAIATLVLALAPGLVHSAQYGEWGDPQPVSSINTIAAAEGCPIESPDGLSLYIASNRAVPAAQGKLDIYRALRESLDGPWSEPVNLGAEVNSGEFDYCPTPMHGNWLMFVSSRQTDDDCFPGDVPPTAPPGGPSAGDILLTRENPANGWEPPLNLGCYPQGPNTSGAEFSPSLVETGSGTFLFFSSNGYPDSRGQDIYVARRDSPSAPWTAPERIDNPFINTPAPETRASLSADGTRLYFGRKTTLVDPGDVFVSTRARLTGNGRR